MTMEVDIATAQLSADAAREITDQIRLGLVDLEDLITQAFNGQAWTALGYRTWDEYTSAEFTDALPRLSTGNRRQLVGALHDAGMSNRAIAAAVGAGHQTIGRDLESGGPNGPPEADEDVVDAEIVDDDPESEPKPEHRVTGADGKSYPTKPKAEPAKPKTDKKRVPLPDLAKDAGWELRKAVERVERIFNDDRFRANRDSISIHLRSHLDHAASTCQTLLDEINT